MAGAPVYRSHAAVQRIVNQMRHHSKRVIIKDVYVSSTDARAVLPVTEKHLPDIRGHFPGNPVVPAVVMLEAMFQLGAVLGQENQIKRRLDCIHEARFRRIITPEDRELLIEVWDDEKGYRGIAKLDGTTVAEAHFGE